MLYKTILQKVSFFSLLIICCSQDLFASFPHPIDIVYLWVDGSDPDWISIKNCYLPADQRQTLIEDEACSEARFSDHEELKYSLRSLVKFAPFFNHIYLVTMNQRPKWLLEHPQITVVDHQEIFSDLGDLPTFNSQAIESHLSRIPGLSEYFIYFNDDVLLGKDVSPYDFFTQEGKVKVLFEKGWTVSASPKIQATLYRKAWLNSNRFLDAHFIAERRHRLCHAPFALRKSFIEQTQALFPSVFQTNSSHKFRSDQDFNLTNGLLQYIWVYQDHALQGDLTNKMISVYDDVRVLETNEALDAFANKPLHTLCVQDCTTGTCLEICDTLKSFFKALFPHPAPWEKTEGLLDSQFEFPKNN